MSKTNLQPCVEIKLLLHIKVPCTENEDSMLIKQNCSSLITYSCAVTTASFQKMYVQANFLVPPPKSVPSLLQPVLLPPSFMEYFLCADEGNVTLIVLGRGGRIDNISMEKIFHG